VGNFFLVEKLEARETRRQWMFSKQKFFIAGSCSISTSSYKLKYRTILIHFKKAVYTLKQSKCK